MEDEELISADEAFGQEVLTADQAFGGPSGGPGTSFLSGVVRGAGAFISGVGEEAPLALTDILTLGQTPQELIDRTRADNPLSEAGRAVARQAPDTGTYGETFMGQVFGGLGSTVPILAASILHPAAGYAAGVGLGAEAGAERADAAESTGAQRRASAAFGGVIGATEAVPVARMLRRLDKGSGGALKRVLYDAAAEGGEEAVQEFVQSIASDVSDAAILDVEKSLGQILTDAGYSGAVGGTAGAILGGSVRSSTETVRALTGRLSGGDTGATPVPEGPTVQGGDGQVGEAPVAQEVPPQALEDAAADTPPIQEADLSGQETAPAAAGAPQATEAEAGTEQRRFAGQVAADPAIHELVREEAQEWNYRPISNDATRADVRAEIQRLGLDGATALVMNPQSEIAPRVRVTMAAQLIRDYGQAHQELAAKNDPRAPQLLKQQRDIARAIAEEGTRLGQGVQAYSLFSKLSPEAHVQEFEEMLARSVRVQQKRDRRVQQEIKSSLGNARAAAAADVVGDGSDAAVEAVVAGDRKGMIDALVAEGKTSEEATVLATRYSEQFKKKVKTDVRRVLRERFGTSVAGVPEGTVQQGFADPAKHQRDLIGHVTKSLEEAGDYSDAAISEAIDRFYRDLAPRATDEQHREIVKMAERMISAPDDSFIQADRARELIAYMTRQQGAQGNIVEGITAYWYANVLSGLGTQGINVFGNATNLMMHTLQLASTKPGLLPSFLQGMATGSRAGLRDLQAVLTGSAAPKGGKFNAPGFFEALYNPKGKGVKAKAGNVLALGRYVFRALSGVDAFFYRTAKEGRAHALAHQYARERGVQGQAFGDYVANTLFNSDGQYASAKRQAGADIRADGRPLTRRDIERRAFEIMEQSRPVEVQEGAERFGELATYTNPPEGSMGVVADALTNFMSKAVISTRFGDVQLARPVTPFIKILANVMSRQLDFTPVGIARGIKGAHLVGKNPERYAAQERRERLAAGIMGTVGSGLLVSFFSQFDDDDDPSFAITAQGPSDFRKRSQLRETGWQPYSVKVGDAYFKFNELPFALPLAVIGSHQDAKRYDRLSEDEAADKVSHALYAVMNNFLETSFLRGVADIFQIAEGTKDPVSYATSFSRGFVPGAGLLNDVANLTDPVLRDRDSSGRLGTIFKQIPVVRSRLGKSMLNVLGQEIELEGVGKVPIARRFVSTAKPDPVWQMIVENKAFISDPRYSGDIKVTVPSPTRRQKREQSAAISEREQRMGRLVAGVMTEDEEYDYVKLSGEMIYKDLHKRLKTYEKMTPDEIRDDVAWITRTRRKEAKMKMLDIKFKPKPLPSLTLPQ